MEDVTLGLGNCDVLLRIAEALESLIPPTRSSGVEQIAEGYLWSAAGTRLKPVIHISRIDIDLLKRVDSQRETLFDNTRRFVRGKQRITPCYGTRVAQVNPLWLRQFMPP